MEKETAEQKVERLNRIKAQVEQLKQQHGDNIIYLDDVPKFGLVAFRKPSQVEYDRFVDDISRGKKPPSTVMRELVTTCAIHPAGNDFLLVLNEMPGLATSMTGQLSKMVGAAEDIEVKKG